MSTSKRGERPYRGPVILPSNEEHPMEMVRRLLGETLFTQRFYWQVASLVLLAEAGLCALVIRVVPYTEIDWTAYMQQAGTFLKGERDYLNIRGDTGPVVYPAGHLYLYSAFHALTRGGKDILVAQAAFACVYLASLFCVMGVYKAAGAPAILLPTLALSKRLHSIFVLRLFNDPCAMLLFYASTWLLCKRRWSAASVVYSLALSIKMNILLFLPALGLIFFRALGFWGALAEAATIVLVQVLLSLPFTLYAPSSYLSRAFDLSRVFLYKWTVNLRFLPEDVFLDQRLSTGLLVGHACVLALFGLWRWTGIGKEGWTWLARRWRRGEIAPRALSGPYIVCTLFTANLIGVLFSRSLHYQFYAWYAHQVPLLVWAARLPWWIKLALPFTIEYAWNVFPSTSMSSLLLLGSHIVLLAGLWASRAGDGDGNVASASADASAIAADDRPEVDVDLYASRAAVSGRKAVRE